MNQHGKVIVARNEAELPSLEELYRRAQQNGATVSLLDAQALKDIEPCARTVSQALYVKETAVVNPRQVMKSLSSDAARDGIEFRFDCTWLEAANMTSAKTSKGTITYGHLVNCAGLFADRVAHAFGVGRDYRILPFRGQFYRLSTGSRMRVLGNIYPVPDLRNPFLGVHFTRQPEGEVTVGPSALPLLGREQYAGLRGINRQDAGTMCRYLVRLFRRNQDHFRSIAWRELVKVTRAGFFREAGGLGIGLQPEDLLRGKEAGIRAQLVNSRTGDLMNDFVVEDGPCSTHVLNAVSPAFTSSFAFAEHIAASLKLDN
jgi:L-2-hydroxyglutarate oxidase LhgO